MGCTFCNKILKKKNKKKGIIENSIDCENLDNTNAIISPEKTINNIQQVNSFSIINHKIDNKEIKPNLSNKKIPKHIQRYIYKQKEKCVCKIQIKKAFGTGFFCNIPFPNNSNLLPVLITNNHVLGSEDITPENIINLSINDEIEKYIISIGDNRLTFTDTYYDVTIVELKKEDGMDICGLEIDYEKYEAPLEQLNNLQIYLIHYPRSKNVCKSVGEINDISENDLVIKHTCSTAPGSSGCPIINFSNLKVIGVHKGSHPNQNFNLGTFIKGPIQKFNDIHKQFSRIPRFSTFLKYIDYLNMHMEGEEQKKKE